jgi:hypothetical protein
VEEGLMGHHASNQRLLPVKSNKVFNGTTFQKSLEAFISRKLGTNYEFHPTGSGMVDEFLDQFPDWRAEFQRKAERIIARKQKAGKHVPDRSYLDQVFTQMIADNTGRFNRIVRVSHGTYMLLDRAMTQADFAEGEEPEVVSPLSVVPTPTEERDAMGAIRESFAVNACDGPEEAMKFLAMWYRTSK